MCYNNAVAKNRIAADIAQEVECVLGKDEVTGSNPVISSKTKAPLWCFLFWLADRDLKVTSTTAAGGG